MNWRRRIFFAAGQLGLMALARFFFSWNLKFADSRSADGEILLSAALVGSVFLAGRVFDGITDPIAGWLSDWWVRKGRERRTLLWYSLLIPALGMVIIFMPTHDMSGAMRWTFMGSGMFLFFVGYTFYGIPFWSLTDDYSRDQESERRILSTALGAGLILATAAVGIISPLMIEAFGFRTAAILFTFPCIALMALPYFAQPKEGARVHQHTGQANPPLLRQLCGALRHRRFLAVLLIFSGSQMAFMVITVAAPFVATRLLGGTIGDVAWIMLPFLGTSILTFPFAPMLSQRYGWEKMVVVASLALAVVYAGAGGLGEAWIGTPLATAMVLFGFGGPMAAIVLGLEAEAITACARETGGEVTSLYFGAFNFLVKALNGVAAFLTGLLVTMSNDSPDFYVKGVRAMPILAGILLVIGCVGYVLVRPRQKTPDGVENSAT